MEKPMVKVDGVMFEVSVSEISVWSPKFKKLPVDEDEEHSVTKDENSMDGFEMGEEVDAGIDHVDDEILNDDPFNLEEIIKKVSRNPELSKPQPHDNLEKEEDSSNNVSRPPDVENFVDENNMAEEGNRESQLQLGGNNNVGSLDNGLDVSQADNSADLLDKILDDDQVSKVPDLNQTLSDNSSDDITIPPSKILGRTSKKVSKKKKKNAVKLKDKAWSSFIASISSPRSADTPLDDSVNQVVCNKGMNSFDDEVDIEAKETMRIGEMLGINLDGFQDQIKELVRDEGLQFNR